jgi:GT2 family glycosyltransferase
VPGEPLAPRLSIVIPVYNRREFTQQCLEHLAGQTRRDFSTIVVDDGSTDGTGAMVRREHPDTVLLYGDGTLWWTGATNLGAKFAIGRGATHILCLNDDTVPARDFVERLLETAASQPHTLVGAYAVDASTGQPCFGGERINWLTAGARSLLGDRRSAGQRTVEVTHAPGRGLLIPAPVFRRIGYFDGRHFRGYAADYDFTHRARRAGYRIVCDRLAVLGMYPEASCDASCRIHKSWANYRRHLFDVKGGGNLRVFFWYAVRNCPRPLLPVFLAIGLSRRIGGYPLEWVREWLAGARRAHADSRA